MSNSPGSFPNSWHFQWPGPPFPNSYSSNGSMPGIQITTPNLFGVNGSMPGHFQSSMPAQFHNHMPSVFHSSMQFPFQNSVPSPVYSPVPGPVYSSVPSPVYNSVPNPVYSSVSTSTLSSSWSPNTSNQNTDVMPKVTDSPLLTSSPPFPPNWHERYQNTVTSLRNYQLFPVDLNSLEYSTIVSLLDPALITSVDQIVNPTLWTRFVNTRKDMLKSKCNDLELLSKLDLDENELMASYQHSLNFDSNPKVLTVPYHDNMALLFHCTRDPNNIENILRQGLDERMGAASGLLGKGIYFTDNPEKSMGYDGCGGVMFIFAVLLGDCLLLDGPEQLVREPEKYPAQKRNFNDLFFDSIVGQPGANRDNEYVIYNRYQCCPLYMVKYSPGSYTAHANPNSAAYVTSRKYFPPISWTSSKNYCVTPVNVQKTWPFYAKTILAQMGAAVENADEMEEFEADKTTETQSTPKRASKPRAAKTATKPSGLRVKLERLSELGFDDNGKNVESLRKHKYNLSKCVSDLLNQKDAGLY